MTDDRLDVLAVDDERPALEDLARLLRDHPLVRSLQLAGSGAEAVHDVATDTYDAIFLDVRMPDLDGVELAKVLKRFASPPALVFVSAYEDAAVKAFELRAVDYLMKPVSRARIDEALNRVVEARRGGEAAAEPAPAAPAPAGRSEDADVVPVDNLSGGGTRLLPRQSILYMQSHGDYVRIVADAGRFLLRASLSDIERRWESFGFIRVHRRYVVNLRRAEEMRTLLNGTAVLIFADRTEVPVARRQVAELKRRLSS